MGSYQSIHLGPFIIVMHKDAVRAEQKIVCINENCKNHNLEVNTNFCSQCGQEPQNKIFEKPYKKNAWSFLCENEEFVDTLIAVHAGGPDIYKDREILVPNQYMPVELREAKIDSDFCGEVDLTNCAEICKKQTDWMLEKYANQLEALKTEGFELEVKWGLVIHYS